MAKLKEPCAIPLSLLEQAQLSIAARFVAGPLPAKAATCSVRHRTARLLSLVHADQRGSLKRARLADSGLPKQPWSTLENQNPQHSAAPEQQARVSHCAFSFAATHPALADEHFLRTPGERQSLAIARVASCRRTDTPAHTPFAAFLRRAEQRAAADKQTRASTEAAQRDKEEAARKARRFSAHPLPPATKEPRLAQVLARQAGHGRAARDRAAAALAAAEAPFSFAARDAAAAAERAAARAAAALAHAVAAPGFRANPVPASSTQQRGMELAAAEVARREAVREEAGAEGRLERRGS
ncbi:hypothetical protein WJX81_002503 [Elliptochloris bilobata]|uniref:TPX2 C-terminal domain-containing protein n=1 Tax=Elliptochloris bilobata TaxID=381761 RepID=A0AAW1RCJ0_9CHLO